MLYKTTDLVLIVIFLHGIETYKIIFHAFEKCDRKIQFYSLWANYNRELASLFIDC